MRMFAGPNGSGKSKLKSVLPAELLGIYLNPDELEDAIRSYGVLDLRTFQVDSTFDQIRSFFRDSILLRKKGLLQIAEEIALENGKFTVEAFVQLPYVVSVLADFMRRQWIEKRISFTFETVMSAPDKPELLSIAKDAGYRTYLYYIATDDPEINISRVQNRMKLGGHSVPIDKIRDRYTASLDQLMDAIMAANRAYIFDNTSEGTSHSWVAEVENGMTLTYRTEILPAWVRKYVIDKIKLTPSTSQL